MSPAATALGTVSGPPAGSSLQINQALPIWPTGQNAFLQIFVLSGNWILAKNINFYNVRPPLDHTQYCLTVHLFTSYGKSTSVTKKCATRDECHFVGCRHHRETGYTECVSCCEGMICNVEIPTNHTNAVFAVMHAWRMSHGSRRTVNVPLLASVLAVVLL
ncbi:ly6/PLAUR domain-containing protein 6B isoform X3 [Alligator sinensis]|uniref:Ly6/PLAUR domain-containing protein 6B isoform X3 n=1 Tax=Alligator sinensis TaxID=38654 RepID=A0A3Q0HII8_ALLSI|nr:ly6/PLAUR domain-containing protein 6B isoform X3 [Alligator sinensis]